MRIKTRSSPPVRNWSAPCAKPTRNKPPSCRCWRPTPKKALPPEAALTPPTEPTSATAPVAQWVPSLMPAPVPAAAIPALENPPRETRPSATPSAEVALTAFPTGPSAALVAPVVVESPTTLPTVEIPACQSNQRAPAATTPGLRVLPPPRTDLGADRVPAGTNPKIGRKKLPTNSTRVSTTDPEAELARSKNGLIDLNYKDHRLVDDAHGVITAVAATPSNVADGTQFPALYEQHRETTG